MTENGKQITEKLICKETNNLGPGKVTLLGQRIEPQSDVCCE